jgi:hypothetical protein
MKTTSTVRTGNRSAAEKLVIVMGAVHLVSVFLAIPLKSLLLLYFMSAGWAAVLRAFMRLFSGEGLPPLTTLNDSQISIMALGATYAFYHIVLITLFLVVLKRRKSTSTFFWGTLSVVVLVGFTMVGFAFRWT